MTGYNDWVRALVVTPNGKYVISTSDFGTLKACDLKEGKIVSCFTGDSPIEAYDASPDGEFIVAGDAEDKFIFAFG